MINFWISLLSGFSYATKKILILSVFAFPNFGCIYLCNFFSLNLTLLLYTRKANCAKMTARPWELWSLPPMDLALELCWLMSSKGRSMWGVK